MLPQVNRVSFSQAIDGFLLAKDAEGRSQKTLQAYRYYLGLFAAWLAEAGRPDPPLGDITTADVRRFLAALRPRLSPKTISNAYTTLASLYTWAGHELGLPHVIKPIRKPKAPPPVMRLPTRDDIAALLRACDYSTEAETVARRGFRMRRPSALRDRCIILLLADTGLRAAELCGLTVGDVALKTGAVTVQRGKGGRGRTVYAGRTCTRSLWRYLASRPDAGPDAPLFTTLRGSAMSVNGLSRLVRGLGKRAGVKVTPHVLRHVFATEFLRGGGNVLALRRLLGHASDALLALYAEIAEVDLQAAAAKASPADRWRL